MGVRLSLLPKGSNARSLAVGHFLGHVKKETTVAFFNSAHEPAKTTQVAGFLPGAAPRYIVGAFALRKVGQFGWLFAVIEKLIEWNLHGSSQFFKRLDRRNGVTVFDARNVAAKQPGALFNVTLGKFFRFAEQAYTVTNDHVGHCFTD
jgi:hypothetical protein